MAQKLKYDIDEICAYCEYAQTLNNEEKVLCSVRGVVAAAHKCKKFRYDPLKRNPAPPVQIIGLDPDLII